MLYSSKKFNSILHYKRDINTNRLDKRRSTSWWKSLPPHCGYKLRSVARLLACFLPKFPEIWPITKHILHVAIIHRFNDMSICNYCLNAFAVSKVDRKFYAYEYTTPPPSPVSKWLSLVTPGATLIMKRWEPSASKWVSIPSHLKG